MSKIFWFKKPSKYRFPSFYNLHKEINEISFSLRLNLTSTFAFRWKFHLSFEKNVDRRFVDLSKVNELKRRWLSFGFHLCQVKSSLTHQVDQVVLNNSIPSLPSPQLLFSHANLYQLCLNALKLLPSNIKELAQPDYFSSSKKTHKTIINPYHTFSCIVGCIKIRRS